MTAGARPTRDWIPLLMTREWVIYPLLFLLGFGGAAFAALLLPERQPVFHDEFSQLVSAEAFAEGRLTNPTHPEWEFFEAQHVLQQPTYASKYQPGRIFFMAFGLAVAGNPWLGMWILQGLFYPALCWCLRGFLPMRWAIFGSLVAFATFGHASQWAQFFWGGTLPALGGALVFGGAWRLLQNPRITASLLTGLGVLALFWSRPFEGLLACLIPAALCAWAFFRHGGLASRRAWVAVLLPATLIILTGFTFQAVYNQAVTQDWRKFPYMVYEHQYSPISSNFFFADVVEQSYQTPYIERFYETYVLPRMNPELQLHIIFGQRLTDLAGKFAGPVFGILALAGLWKPRRQELLALLMIICVATGSFFNVSFHAFYYSPAYAPFCLLIVRGARRLYLGLVGASSNGGTRKLVQWSLAAGLLLALVHRGYTSFQETSLGYFGEIHTQAAVIAEVEPNSLVFVHYTPNAGVHETFHYNTAQIDEQSVVFANDLGPAKNVELLKYYESQNRRPYFLIVDRTANLVLSYNPPLIEAVLEKVLQQSAQAQPPEEQKP